MLETGLANVTMFFLMAGICLAFVMIWIVKSESRIKICKQEIKKLKAEIDSSQSEKFVLAEKISALENIEVRAAPLAERAPEELIKKNDALEAENKRLKNELADAKKSVEEVYDALASRRT